MTDKSIRKVIDDGLSTLKTVLYYSLLPVALPFVVLQEIISWVQRIRGFNNRSLEKKVVLLTGASSGIGEGLAHAFYEAGCRLILVSRRKSELERVKNDLVRLKTNGTVYVPVVLEMDLADLNSIPSKAAAALAIYDKIDILINNAGMSNRGTVLDTELSVHLKIMNINYFGTLALTKEIAAHMVERQKGHIVFMSSVQGKFAIPERSAYAASKHALQAMADSLRAEVAEKNVDVTVISPGYVKTNISLNALTGSGAAHGEMDESTEKGYSTEYFGEKCLQAILNREKDVVIAQFTAKVALLFRCILPSLYFYIMAKRARNASSRAAK